MKQRSFPSLPLLAASFLILLFVYTACSKLLHASQFIQTMRLTPFAGRFASSLAWMVPGIELLISMLLFLPSTRRRGLFYAFLLMLSFTLYVGAMLLLLPNLPCSCGGVIKSMGWKTHLVFNAACTLLAWTGWRVSSNDRRTSNLLLQ
ncbi:MAG TPA: MauE/DoxX family redox-associated membrane protein [Flavisolibacter sp.]|nr:MauE/DoxX family redox-associated membrane protein [Flavisolibacter sp.]